MSENVIPNASTAIPCTAKAFQDNKPDSVMNIQEFNTWMTSVGSFEPDLIVEQIPKLNFVSLKVSIMASRQAIEFLKSHPSLPVSFDTGRAVRILASHLHKQETLATLFELTGDTDLNSPLHEIAKRFASEGNIEALSVLLRNHLIEIRGHVDLVKELLGVCPFDKATEPAFQAMVRTIVLPGLRGGLSDLAEVLVSRARHAGCINEPKVGLSALAILDDEASIFNGSPSPLEEVRSIILLSEKPQVATMVGPTKKVLELLLTASEQFGIDSLSFLDVETNPDSTLESAATHLLVSTGNLGVFCEFCSQFNVDRDQILARQVMAVKDQIYSGESSVKKSRMDDSSFVPSTDSLVEVLYSLICEIKSPEMKSDCLYSALTAVHALNLPGEATGRFEALAIEMSQPGSLLELYMSIRSVRQYLEKFDEYEFIRERPDFLMRQENVLQVATQLAIKGEMETVYVLAETFPYIDKDEMLLTHLVAMIGDPESLVRRLQDVSDEILNRFTEIMLMDEFSHNSLVVCDSILPRVSSNLRSDIKKLKLLLEDFNKKETRETLVRFVNEGAFVSLLEDSSENEIERKIKLERARVVFELPTQEVGQNEETIEYLRSEVARMDARTITRMGIERILHEAHKQLVELPANDYRITLLVEEVICPVQELLVRMDAGEVGDDPLIVLSSLESDCSKVEIPQDFASKEIFYTLKDFSDSVSMSNLFPDIDIYSSRSTAVECSLSALTKRVKWGALFERLSIPFSAETLLHSFDPRDAVQKTNIKKILNDCFPSLAVKSGYDLEILRRFGNDFGRSDVDVLIKALEIGLCEEAFSVCHRILTELSTIDSGPSVAEKLAMYILPSLGSDAAVRWLSSNVVSVLPEVGQVWTRLSKMISLLDDMTVPDGIIRKLVSDSQSVVLDLVSKHLLMRENPCGDGLMDLAFFALDRAVMSKIVCDIIKKISAYPDLIYQIDIAKLQFVIDSCLSGDDLARRVRELVQTLPLCEEQRTLAVHYKAIIGVSEADLKLLENRLVLKRFNVSSSIEMKLREFNFSLKKVVEYVYQTSSCCCEELVDQLIRVNEADGFKIRLDIAKRWIAEESPTEAQVTAILRPLGHDPVIIGSMLKLYFNQNIELMNRILCFNALFHLFPKDAIVAVYNNPIEDLVEIQKNLVYIYLLTQKNKVMRNMEYKDFVSLDKCLVVKNLVATSNREYLLLASALIADFAINDYQLVEKLEERVKIVANQSFGLVKDRLHRAGILTGKELPLSN